MRDYRCQALRRDWRSWYSAAVVEAIDLVIGESDAAHAELMDRIGDR